MSPSDTIQELRSTAASAASAAAQARREAAAYAQGADRPLGGYAILMGTYATSTAGLGAIVR